MRGSNDEHFFYDVSVPPGTRAPNLQVPMHRLGAYAHIGRMDGWGISPDERLVKNEYNKNLNALVTVGTPFSGLCFESRGEEDRDRLMTQYACSALRTPEERWSIVQGRHVVAYAAVIMLKDVTFKVSAAGVARAKRLGHKVVCAHAVGLLVGSGMGITTTEGQDLPMKVVFDLGAGAFVAKGSRRVQKSSAVALFNERGCSTAYST